jgi:hypothetical protein
MNAHIKDRWSSYRTGHFPDLSYDALLDEIRDLVDEHIRVLHDLKHVRADRDRLLRELGR